MFCPVRTIADVHIESDKAKFSGVATTADHSVTPTRSSNGADTRNSVNSVKPLDACRSDEKRARGSKRIALDTS